jgi:hypothetical protein
VSVTANVLVEAGETVTARRLPPVVVIAPSVATTFGLSAL